jgi:DNA-binding transcriptional MerR regulator
VAERDSAFLWETEALRAATIRTIPHIRRIRAVEPADWLTLRQAAEITGVPVPTLRKWALRDNVPSYLERTAVGQLRMVSLQGIYQRAEELGRQVETRPERRPGPTQAPPAVDLTDEVRPSSAQREVPEGTMLVPLDAWNKMLNQLGNLHEAGQQLAEARERAAKAETQATFLRERLAELRVELAQARDKPTVSLAESAGVPVPAAAVPSVAGTGALATGPRSPSLAAYSMEMTKRLYAKWKVRRRR